MKTNDNLGQRKDRIQIRKPHALTHKLSTFYLINEARRKKQKKKRENARQRKQPKGAIPSKVTFEV